MLSKKVAGVVTRVLEEYVEQIDTQQVTTEIWSGSFRLNNLKLKTDALQQHQIPLKIEKGIIKSISGSFPWKTIKTDSSHVQVDTVLVLANLDRGHSISGVSENLFERARSALDKVYRNGKAELCNFHVRIEAGEFALGVKMESAKMTNVDENGKRYEIEGLGVYLDRGVEPILADSPEFEEQMLECMRKDHTWVLSPCACRCDVCPKGGVTRVSFHADEVNLNVDFEQCEILEYLKGFVERSVKQWCYAGNNRPPLFGDEDLLSWWEYGYECAALDNGKVSLERVLRFLQNRNQSVMEERDAGVKMLIENYQRVKNEMKVEEKLELNRSDLEHSSSVQLLGLDKDYSLSIAKIILSLGGSVSHFEVTGVELEMNSIEKTARFIIRDFCETGSPSVCEGNMFEFCDKSEDGKRKWEFHITPRNVCFQVEELAVIGRVIGLFADQALSALRTNKYGLGDIDICLDVSPHECAFSYKENGQLRRAVVKGDAVRGAIISKGVWRIQTGQYVLECGGEGVTIGPISIITLLGTDGILPDELADLDIKGCFVFADVPSVTVALSHASVGLTNSLITLQRVLGAHTLLRIEQISVEINPLDVLATVQLEGVQVQSLRDTIIKTIKVIPKADTVQGIQRVIQISPDVQISCDLHKKEYTIEILSCSVNVDLAFWQLIVNYFAMLPAYDFGDFIFCVKMTELLVLLPTASTKSLCFAFKSGFSFTKGPKLISLGVTNFTISVQDMKSGMVSLGLTNTIDVKVEVVDTGSANMWTVTSSDIEVKLSPQDWHLVSEIIETFTHVIYARITLDSFGPWGSMNNQLALDLGTLNFVLCNDSMALLKNSPIFDLEVPPTKLEMSRIDSISLETTPCLKFFNFSSASWDYLIEPTKVSITSRAQEEEVDAFRIKIDKCFVNLSVTVAQELHAFWQQMSKDKQIITTTDLPDYWIGSRLNETVTIDPGTAPFNMTCEEQLPLYGVDGSTPLKIDIGDRSYSIVPSAVVYPTLLSTSLTVSRRSFNGGILLELSSPFRLENALPVAIEVYEEHSKAYENIAMLAPGAQFPITFTSTKPKCFVFKTENASTGKLKRVELSSATTERLTYSVCGEFTCCITTYIDTMRGTKVFKLFSPVTFVNKLPMNIYVNYTDKEAPVLMKPNAEAPLLFQDKGARNFSASFSLDGSVFQKKKSFRQSNESIHQVGICNPMQDTMVDAFLLFESDVQDGQVTITLLAPVILKNLTRSALTVKDSDSDYKVELFPSAVELWCPPAFLKKRDRLMVEVTMKDTGGESKNAVDCTSFGDSLLFLPCLDESKANLRVPIRCHSESVNSVYHLSFGSVLRVMNELADQLTLVPIKDIGLSTPIADVYTLDPSCGCTIDELPESGCFLLAISGYESIIEVCLLQETCTVCQVRRGATVLLVELEVQLTSNGFLASFKKPRFPAPLMINNSLDVPIEVYQDRKEFSLTVEPNTSTSFGFEKPFGQQNIHFVIGNDDFERGFADDFECEELGCVDGRTIYLTTRAISCGMKVVSVSDVDIRGAAVPISRLLVSVKSLRVSLIDKKMQELLSLTFDGIQRNFSQMSDGLLVETSVIDSIQVDDANPRAIVPVVLFNESSPAVRYEMVVKTENKDFWRVIYSNSCAGSLELNIDSSLVTDIIEYSKDVYDCFKDLRPLLRLPALAFGVDWMEASSLNVKVTYRSTTDRPTITSQIDPYIRCLPSVIKCPFTVQQAVVKSFSGTYKTVLRRLFAAAMQNIFRQVMEQFGESEQSRVQIQKLASSWHIPFSTDDKAIRILHRIDDIDMCLNRQLIQEKKRIIEQYNLEPSSVINALESAKDDESDQNITIMARGRLALSGMFSITRRRSSSASAAHMSGRTHKGGPRCFVNNQVSIYNEDVSTAQLVIWRRGMLTERIRMYCRCQVTNRFVCFTDQFVFVLNPNIQEVVYEIFVGHISSLDSMNNEVTVKGKKLADVLTVRCEDISEAQRIKMFVASQRYMALLFGRSLL